ncbi:MAG: RHS repeat-associated core domain-containing protein [Bacteroidales bacterium]|nr:RHS repeat-associated core domain-containing protein [Bacteroidales bacterium]
MPPTPQIKYHPDHLGSASWITDSSGQAVQHMQYLPYGETKLDQRTSSYQERYTFSGKEKDSETGYHYFGARYYNSDLSLWLSVDPMSDKYPNLSPYNYCAWNPMKLVDPNGQDIKIYYKNKTGIARLFERKKHIVYVPNMEYSGNNPFVKETVNALNYVIKGDSKGIITKLANDQEKTVKIKKGRIGEDCYKGLSKTIEYHPQSGLEIINDEGEKTGVSKAPH